MSVLIFGAGFLGRRLLASLEGARLDEADIADAAQVARALDEHRPEVVINAAGKTGHPNVDWCEDHVEETVRSNTIGPIVLAEACARRGVHLLHFGSGCIFYGPSPSPGGWREDDFANPVSRYSRSKYAADLALADRPGVAIVRIRMPIDPAPGPRNLLTKLARYPVVADVENSITVVEDLLAVVAGLVERRASGVFHATNPGTMRHAELLELYRRHVDPAHRYTLVGEEELAARGLVRLRRSNCTLADRNLAALGLTLRPVRQAVEEAVRAYAIAFRASAGGVV
ncbi:MAG: sugar nucleotide-binding protein [Myxococcota bacterium]